MKNKAPHLNTEGGRDIATTGRRGIHAATEGGRGMKCTCATSAYTISQQRGKKENTPKVRSRLSLRGARKAGSSFQDVTVTDQIQNNETSNQIRLSYNLCQ